MKRLILTILTAGVLTSASAQLFSPESLNGALLGTMIGGIAGGDCHHGFSGSGAAIGAGVGLLAGAVVGEVQRQNYYASQPYYYYPAPVYAQPVYPVYLPAQPSAPRAAPTTRVSRPVASSAWAHQIPDAPLVPDAPTF
jgi:predicted lipid-binding transport protein (Tim44 family)